MQVPLLPLPAAQSVHLASDIVQQLVLALFKKATAGGVAEHPEQVVEAEHVEQPKSDKVVEQHLSVLK